MLGPALRGVCQAAADTGGGVPPNDAGERALRGSAPSKFRASLTDLRPDLDYSGMRFGIGVPKSADYDASERMRRVP